MNALTYDYSEFIEILSKWDMVGMSLSFIVCWNECYALYFEIYDIRGENLRGLYSDVVVTTADRQRPLEGDISFLKTKLSSR